MKLILIGTGSVTASLTQKLTEQGHSVTAMLGTQRSHVGPRHEKASIKLPGDPRHLRAEQAKARADSMCRFGGHRLPFNAMHRPKKDIITFCGDGVAGK
jgi:hypothetical protein